MDTSALQIDPEELKRNLAITLGTQAPQLGHYAQVSPGHDSQAIGKWQQLGRPEAMPQIAGPGPIAMPQPKAPDLSVSQPKVNAPRGTVEGDQAYRTHLLDSGAGVDQISGRIKDSSFGQNHPNIAGVLGPVAQGLGKVGSLAVQMATPFGPLIPGTEEHHLALLNQANHQVGDEEGERQKEAETQASQAEVPLRQAQTANVQAAAPVEITPEQAQALGSPELAGEKVSPTVLAQLSKQRSINDTRESTTTETNQTKKDIAGTKAQSVTDTNASREKIAAAANAVRTSLGHMRAASGIAKGGPTMTTRAMAEMATTVLPRMTAISGEVDRLANELGPAVGRWNELMVNKGGADHPEFAHLDTDLDLLASAIVRTHFGARGGQQYRQELRKQFGEAQSPEDLKARIAAAQDWIQGYADMGQAPNAPGAQAPRAGSSKDVDDIVTALKGGKK